jgi:hypothetical protein
MPRVVPAGHEKPAPEHIGAFISREQRRRLVARAREEDRSVSAIIRRAIDNYLAMQAPASTLDFRAEAAELQNLAGRRVDVAPAPSAQAPAGADR